MLCRSLTYDDVDLGPAHLKAPSASCCHSSGDGRVLGCRHHVTFTPRVERGTHSPDVLLSCSPEAGTRRRKPGQKMSVWLPRYVRRAILMLAAILIFIYLQRSPSDAGSWLS